MTLMALPRLIWYPTVISWPPLVEQTGPGSILPGAALSNQFSGLWPTMNIYHVPFPCQFVFGDRRMYIRYRAASLDEQQVGPSVSGR
jgi:hypothetical protein